MRDPDQIKNAIRGYLSENIGDSSTEHRLLAYAMTYIETLEGVIKADPVYYFGGTLKLVKDMCFASMHCSECPLSDADGDCPFSSKPDYKRLDPFEWELERMGGQNEEL